NTASIANLIGPPIAAASALRASDFIFRAQNAGNFTLQVDGSDLQIIDTRTGAELARQPIGLTSAVIIDGVDYVDDTLHVNLNRGSISVPITFNGGAGGFDSLSVDGGTVSRSMYTTTGPDSGTITLDALVIHYTGLEPVEDTTGPPHDNVTFDP